MQSKLAKFALLLIAAVMLVSIAFAGAASAVIVDNEADLKSNLTGTNYVELGRDIQLTNFISIESKNNPTLDLKGYTITAAKDKYIFKVVGGNITLIDSVGGGVLKGNGTTSSGAGALYLSSYANVTMRNVTIRDCCYSGNQIGTVDVGFGCTFIMMNSTIANCHGTSATGKAGAVFLRPGTFIMEDSSIRDCTAGYYGGGYLYPGGQWCYSQSYNKK